MLTLEQKWDLVFMAALRVTSAFGRYERDQTGAQLHELEDECRNLRTAIDIAVPDEPQSEGDAR